MTPTILVTGGTGTLGRIVVPLLREAGRELRVLSRHDHAAGEGVEYVNVDLLEEDGIEPALDGIDVVLHLAGGPKGDDKATANLMAAAVRAGVRHVVYISVIGADRVPLGYFAAKLGAERAVIESGLPWTVLRAAQFHDLALNVVGTMAKLPVMPAPGGMRLEPVDARDVAARLAELTLGDPAGRVADLAGPTVYDMADLGRAYLRARGRRRPTLRVRMPGKAGRAYRAGENLAAPGADTGTRTWEDFLTERVGGPAPASRTATGVEAA